MRILVELWELIIDNKNLSEQQLKLFMKYNNNLKVFNSFNNGKLIEFFIKKPILILGLYKKFNLQEFIDICCKNPYVLKLVFTYHSLYNFYSKGINEIIKIVVEKNVKGFKYLPKSFRSMQSNKEMVLKVIEKDSEMIKNVCDLTFALFKKLCKKNKQLKQFEKALCFKKE
ncbi:hypothetical protein ABK040_008918 [Willaertia magna]